MTAALRELEQALLQELGRRLVRFGFSSRPKGQTFSRSIDGGRVAVHISFIEHAADVDVTTDVAIRFDAVEDLVHRSDKLLSPKHKAQTYTLGVELGNLERGEPFRLTLATRGDVPHVAEATMTKLESVGLPYIERHSRPETAYDLLSKDDRAVWMHAPIHAERAKRACALLAIMGRQSEIADLAARKRAFLQSINDPGAAAFTRFVAELSTS
ncbi:MAG TPA: hypothetical protein VFT22_21395 [Kofleriaceae bacterium]|nr:hypothetical protein [Kofleriaceae bacterium]